MIRLASFVRTMILEGKTAAVPGLGTFHVRHIPARIDETDRQFKPPAREIIFEENRYLQNAAFISELAQSEGIASDAAFQQLAEYLNACYSQIGKGKRIELTGLGLLFRDANEKLIFEADKEMMDGGEFYGMQAVPLNVPVKSKPVKKKTKKVRKPLLFRLFLILLLLGGVAITAYWGYIVYEMIRNPKNTGPTHSFGPAAPAPAKNLTKRVYQDTLPAFPPVRKEVELVAEPETLAVTVSDTLEQTPDTKPAVNSEKPKEKPKEKLVQKKTEPDPDENIDTGEQKYYIIAGCFRSEDGARRFVKELKAKGFDASLVGKTASGLNMVSYSSFLNKSLAEQELKRIRQDENEGAYMVLR
jgi:cell division septation protein DedD/nucleoid DNA-binding protein